MYCVDTFATESIDTRLAIVAVAIVLGWPSARGLSISNIAAITTLRLGDRELFSETTILLEGLMRSREIHQSEKRRSGREK